MVKAIGLLCPVLVPLIVSGILFFSSEKRNIPKLFLAFYMLVITFVFLANYYYFEHNYNIYIYLHSLHIATVLAIYPGAYIYIRLLTYSEGNKRRAFLHLLPSLLFFVASASIFFLFLNMEERAIFLTKYRFHPDFSRTWMKILYYVRMANIVVLFIQVFLYVFLIWRLLKNHASKVVNIFSNPEKFQLNWLRAFNMALALSALVCVFMYTVNPEKLFGDDRFLSYPLLIVATILWFFGIMGNNQSALPELERKPSMPSNVPKGEGGELVVKLEQYFREKKPYLDSNLTIYDVAKELGSNRTYISHTINSEYEKNFSAYVNGFRVEEAKRLIDAGSDETLLGIAEECGFGSLSSLGRSFKSEYGESVADYRG